MTDDIMYICILHTFNHSKIIKDGGTNMGAIEQ
jgi:hypothetical protein